MHWYVNYPESETFFSPAYNVDLSYPAHLHSCLEVSFCVSGKAEVTLEGQSYEIGAGQGILIPPNTVHSYHTPETSAYYTILFSRNLLPDFSAMFFHRKPIRYTFEIDTSLNQHILAFFGSEHSLFGGKALLYRTVEAFLRHNAFVDADNTGAELTMRILSYIQDNLCAEITLQDMADHLGYSYFYISKRIRQDMNVPFTTLLSQYRVAKAKTLLNSGQYTVSQAALASGFGSIRSFNRVFHNLTGLTPSQYLSQPNRQEVFRLVESEE